jgi:hypothetical protein
MVADELDYVVGVDTHVDEHVLAVVAGRTDRRLASCLSRSRHGNDGQRP